MMGLHLKQLSHTRSTVPTPEHFIQHGVWMPAISLDGEPWELESRDILHKLGF